MATITEVKENLALSIKDFSFWYQGSKKPNLNKINMPVADKKVTALIGPSGCGKSTLLRSINRIHDLYPGNRYEGEISFCGENILSSNIDLINLRIKIGMIFQETEALFQFRFSIMKDNVTMTLDTSGEGLHKRGYRRFSNAAPIKETLAAGIADLARIRDNDIVCDPF